MDIFNVSNKVVKFIGKCVVYSLAGYLLGGIICP